MYLLPSVCLPTPHSLGFLSFVFLFYRHDRLEEELRRGDMLPAYQWYLDLRKYGSAPHAGFGMGFERFLQFLSGVKQIRDTIAFPRYANKCRL